MTQFTPTEEQTLQRVLQELTKRPPKIGLVGVSGVGKSSTINTLFKTNLPISHTVACTKEFRDVPLRVQATQGVVRGQEVKLTVCDAPGLGEDVRSDPRYIDMYRSNLPECDIIFWVTSARNRAIALDQTYLTYFPELYDRIVFGLSQVDLVEPMNWKPGLPIPSREQERNIEEIVKDRSQRLSEVLGRRIEVIPYSNARGYNLETLFTSLLKSCTGNRSWMFSTLKNFSFDDFVPTETRERVRQQSGEKAHSRASSAYQGNQRQPSSRFSAGIRQALQSIIGRDDVDSTPLNDEELSRLETWIKQVKNNR